MDGFVSVDGFVDGVVDKVGNEKTLAWALPNEKPRLYNGILTDLHTLTIHISVYLILVFQII